MSDLVHDQRSRAALAQPGVTAAIAAGAVNGGASHGETAVGGGRP